MTIALVFYVISLVMFISSGLRRYASDFEYKRTGQRLKNYNYAIRGVISFVCFIIGTWIMMNI